MKRILLARIGDWNPQLFRELKGNLKVRNIIITITIVLIAQFLMMVSISDSRCLDYDSCRWEINWQDGFQTLNYFLPLIGFMGGVYQLISDLYKEQSRGTLNFIRLSPQSSQKILRGKLLGVPVLIYLGLALCIPFHLIAGLASGMPLSWILATYTLWLALGVLFYTAALFYSLSLENTNILNTPTTYVSGLGCVAAFFLGLPFVKIVDFSYDLYHSNDYIVNGWSWFKLPLGQSPFMAYIWLIATLLTASFWIWKSINRRFNNPNKTSLDKLQSYGVAASFQLWLLGFFIPGYGGGIREDHFGVGLVCLFGIVFLFMLIIVSAITPHRQHLLDWARYGHKMSQKSLRNDLLVGEKSPALLAMGIHALITVVLWSSWVLFTPKYSRFNLEISTGQIIIAMVLMLMMLLIYAAIIQLTLFLKTSKRAIISGIIFCIVAFCPLILGGILAAENAHLPLIWAFSPFPVLVFMEGSTLTALLGFMGQVGILSSLTMTITRTLQKAGESETKTLFYPGVRH
jgi:hypothetical protein